MEAKEIFDIREANFRDADAIAAIFHNTVHQINIRDYTPTQIEKWAGTAPEPEKWRERLETKQTFVACLDLEIVGFAEFEADGHIDALYVHHDHQGEGIASCLLQRIELEAERSEIVRLYTEASTTALHFFKKKGFVIVQPQEVEYRGEKFRNYRMEKWMTA